jgi:hypothetical protein
VIGIVIPLKSAAVSKNWQVTCEQLKSTINSIENQNDKRYRYVVVGHECPKFLIGAKLANGVSVFHKIIELEAPEPSKHELNQAFLTNDKNMKIAVGIRELASAYNDIQYWFPLDADDLIRSDFVEKILSLPKKAGVVLNKGYIYYSQINRKRLVSRFYEHCGSSCLIAKEVFELPDIIDSKSMLTIPFCNFAHMNMIQYFENKIKSSFHLLNEGIIMYVVGHGENISSLYEYEKSKLNKIKAMIKPFVFGSKLSHRDKSNFFGM